MPSTRSNDRSHPVDFELPTTSNICGTALLRIDDTPLFDTPAVGSGPWVPSENGKSGNGWCYYNSGFSAVKPGPHKVCACLGACLDSSATWFCTGQGSNPAVSVVAGQTTIAHIDQY